MRVQSDSLQNSGSSGEGLSLARKTQALESVRIAIQEGAPSDAETSTLPCDTGNQRIAQMVLSPGPHPHNPMMDAAGKTNDAAIGNPFCPKEGKTKGNSDAAIKEEGFILTKEEFYKSVIQSDPLNPDGYFHLANTLPSGGHVTLDGIVRTKEYLYDKAHRLAVGRANHMDIGNDVQDIQGYVQKTLEERFKNAIILDPSDADAYYNLASICPPGGEITLNDGNVMTVQMLYKKARDLGHSDAASFISEHPSPLFRLLFRVFDAAWSILRSRFKK